MKMYGESSPFQVPSFDAESSFDYDDLNMYPSNYETATSNLSVQIPNGIKLEPDCNYTDLSPIASEDGPIACSKRLPSAEANLLSWTTKHPSNWTSSEVLDWLFYVAGRLEVDFAGFRAEAFQNLSGVHMCRMNEHDFKQLLPDCGTLIYTVFTKVLSGSNFEQPQPFSEGLCDDTMSSDFKSNVPGIQAANINENQHYFGGYPLDTPHSSSIGSVEEIGGHYYDYNINEFDELIPSDSYSTRVPYESDKEEVFDGPHNIYNGYNPHMPCATPPPSSMPLRPTCHPHDLPISRPKQRFSLPSSSGCSDDGSDLEAGPRPKIGGNRGRKPGQTKGNHLWEFIRDLLKNNQYCGKLIKWEDRKDGVFRFVQSEAVAQMWGRKKNNPQMTYEKLSRAMRYYYKRGILERVDGRRLVYKFGKNSHGWQL